MKLLVMRHGRAESPRPGRADADRALTTIGVDMLRHQARAMLHAGLAPDVLYCSPYVRARQTAEALADLLKMRFHVAPELAPGAGLPAYQALIDAMEDEHPQVMMCVHHQPDVSGIVHTLTGALIPMEEGNLAAIEVRQLGPGQGVLKGVYEAERMARIGRYLAKEG